MVSGFSEKRGKYCEYPSALKLSAGMNRSAAELMQ